LHCIYSLSAPLSPCLNSCCTLSLCISLHLALTVSVCVLPLAVSPCVSPLTALLLVTVSGPDNDRKCAREKSSCYIRTGLSARCLGRLHVVQLDAFRGFHSPFTYQWEPGCAQAGVVRKFRNCVEFERESSEWLHRRRSAGG